MGSQSSERSTTRGGYANARSIAANRYQERSPRLTSMLSVGKMSRMLLSFLERPSRHRPSRGCRPSPRRPEADAGANRDAEADERGHTAQDKENDAVRSCAKRHLDARCQAIVWRRTE
jgi:hypothetical protein